MIVTADSRVPQEVVDRHRRHRRLRAGRTVSLWRPAPCSAWLRSATRSSRGLDAAGEPHQVGGHGGVGVLDRLVGHRLRHLDQRLDAAERLGQREDLRRAPRSASPPGGGTRPSRRSPASARRSTPRGARAGTRSPPARSRCARPPAGAACAGRGGRGSSRTARAPRRPRSGRSARARAAPRRPPRPRRRRRRSARRGTWSPSARRRRRRARAGAARRAWRTCCRPPRARRPRARRPPRCRRRSAAGWWASRPRSSRVSGRSAALERVEVGLVDEVVLEPEAREHLVDQPVGAAVEVARQDHVVARAAVRRDQRVRGRHAAGEGASRGRPRARRARARAPRASGSPSARSRSPRRTRPGAGCT